MTLQPQSISAAAFNDDDAGGNNYFSGKAIYVHKTNGSYASIYSDSGGVNLIAQNGINNVTNDKGVFTFYIDGGEYYAQSDGERVGFWVTNAELIESYAIRAEDAAASASTEANIFDTVADGESGTVNGDWFSVPSGNDNGAFDYYKNESGVGVYKKTSSTAIAVTNSFDNVVNYTYENFVSGGDFIESNPEMRSGSITVDLSTQQELINRGYKKAVQWRIGNDFARAEIGSDIDGKYAAGCVLIYSDNPANLPSSGTVLNSETSGGSIAPVSLDVEIGFIEISSNLVLAYQYGQISQAGAVNLLVGTTVSPVDSTRYATGFFATVSDAPFNVDGFIADALIRDKCRLDNYKVVDSMSYAKTEYVDNKIGDVFNGLYSNEFAEGDFIAGTPEIRSGSEVSPLSSDDFLKVGISRGINWRSGNEFLFTENKPDLNGKYIFAAMYARNDDSGDLPPFAYAFSSDSTGSLTSLQDIETGYVEINANFRLCWFKGLINDTSVERLAVGSTYSPTTTTLFASGFYAITSSSEIDTAKAINSIFVTDKCRKQIVNNVQTKQTSNVSIGADGEYSYVNGYQGSNQITRRLIANPNGGIDVTQVFNFYGDYINGDIVKSGNDDVAPQRALTTTIGANHGYIMGKYLVSSHGKADADVGSVWSIGAEEFVILGIRTPDTLWIAHRTNNASSALIDGTFTHVSGAVNTSSFSGVNEGSQQFYPPFQDKILKSIADGVEVFEGSVSYSDKFKFIESYDVLERSEVISWFEDDRQAGEFKPYGRDPSYSVSMTYEFDVEANCTIYSDITFLKDSPVKDLMFLQAMREEVDRYYIPKTLAFTQGGQNFDYNLIESATKLSSTGAGTVYFDSAKYESTGLVMDRFVGFNDSSNTIFSMGYLPIRSAENSTRRTNTSNRAWEIRGNTDKMYPRVVDKGNFTASAGEHYSIIGYRNVFTRELGITSAYPVRSSAGDYFYMDWHDTNGVQRVELPSDYQGRSFTVVESKNVTVYGDSVTNSILVGLATAGTYGFLTLKMV